MSKNQWTRETRDTLADEFGLFFFSRSRPDVEPWLTRLNDWERHVNLEGLLRREKTTTAVDILKKSAAEQLGEWCDARIQILTEHLNVIEGKISMLFNLNTLLLIALNVMIGVVLNLLPRPIQRNPWIESLGILATAFGAVWLMTTGICLLAARRIVWGDLGRYKNDSGQDVAITLNSLTSDQLVDAEEQHVKAMIVAVVARTNKFRIAVVLIWIEVVVMVGALVLGGLIVAHSVGNPPPDLDVQRVEGQFVQGVHGHLTRRLDYQLIAPHSRERIRFLGNRSKQSILRRREVISRRIRHDGRGL